MACVSADGKTLHKHYLETILPPFIAILKCWRMLLLGIHELTNPNGLNPLLVDDHGLATDSLPLQVCKCLHLNFVSPEDDNLVLLTFKRRENRSSVVLDFLLLTYLPSK